MQVSDFTQEMTRRGCVADNKIFCGTYQGFPFAVRFISGKEGRRTTFNLSVQFASKVPTKMFRQARASVKGLGKLYNAKNNPTLYSVTLEVPKDENLGTAFDQLMTATVEAAQTFALAAPIGCPICNLPGCDAYAYHGESYQPVHAACVHNHALTQAAKAEDNALNGSYALGGLGALLGALVGALPTVLLVVFFDRISGLLCALIPLCAYYGYKLLRGRMNRAALVASIVASLAVAPVVDYLIVVMTMLVEESFFVGPTLYFEIMAQMPQEFLASFLQNLLFIGIGIFCVSRIISRTNTHTVNEANYSLATLRPIVPVAQNTVQS